MARETWTDERLDDLKEGMDGRFDRLEADIRELRGDIKGMQRLMVQCFIGISTLMLTGFGVTIF